MKRDRRVSKLQANLMFAVLREIKDVSFAEASRRSGVCASTISKWCKSEKHGGVRFPQLRTLIALADAYGLEIAVMPREQPLRLAADGVSAAAH